MTIGELLRYDLPLVGRIEAAGRTESELRQEIRDRLEAGYMYDPPVNLFVAEYRSRMVGVIGAVEKPGFYPLASEADTLLDALALAGMMAGVRWVATERATAATLAFAFAAAAKPWAVVVVPLAAVPDGPRRLLRPRLRPNTRLRARMRGRMPSAPHAH